MNFIGSLTCRKGITLNSQLIDLLSILDDMSLTEEEQNKKIVEYINALRGRVESKEEAEKNGMGVIFFLEDIIKNNADIPENQKRLVLSLYEGNLAEFDLCDADFMHKVLKDNGINEDIHESLIKDSKNIDYRAKEGILDLTPEMVRKLYNHMFKDGKNTYERVTFDEAGKYSLYMGLDGTTICNERLDNMIQFCESHGMKSKINTLMFYCDFPKIYEASLDAKVSRGELTEEGKKDAIKRTLITYAKDIASRYNSRVENIDIFNELIYDIHMREQVRFGGIEDIYKEEDTYHLRHEGWQKYLSTEDLCEIALEVRKLMPEATFTYNDVNWVNKDKRAQIIDLIKQIKEIENRYRAEGKLNPDEKGLIDVIGLEAHLTTGDTVEDIEQVVSDVENELGLPIEVTELDIARVGENPLSPEEILKQTKIVEKFIELAKCGRIGHLTVWSQSDGMSFMDDKCGHKVYASVILDENMDEKNYDPTIVLNESEIDQFEAQAFNFHTHTKLCGHAGGEIEEYILNAIKSGKKTLGFSDHTPNVMGKYNSTEAMHIDSFEPEYVEVLKEMKKNMQIKLKLILD